MKKTTFSVEGMMCGGCVAAVEKAALGIQGVKTAVADLKANKLDVEYDEVAVSPEAVAKVVSEAGYACSL